MKVIRTACNAVFIATVAACATAPSLQPGDSEQAVVARLGQPTHVYADGQNRELEYMTGPAGQQTWMAKFDPSGKLISYEQVLTTQKFATLAPGKATKDDVLRTVGAPSETSYLSLSELEVWSYPYKESGAWNSIMHIHFDHAGIVRRMENGPDRKRDPEWRRR